MVKEIIKKKKKILFVTVFGCKGNKKILEFERNIWNSREKSNLPFKLIMISIPLRMLLFFVFIIVVLCDSYLSEKTYGGKWAKCRSEAEWNESIARAFVIQACTPFVMGRMIGWGAMPPTVWFRGIFEISFLRVSINILLCNPNLNIVNIFFPCSCGRRQIAEPR